MMRASKLAFVFSALVLFPGSLAAREARPHRLPPITVNARGAHADPNHETYRGHYVDLSAIVGRKDSSQMADGLRHQIDIVEDSGLSPRALQVLQTVPVVVDDFACVGYMTAPTSGEAKPAPAGACYSRMAPELIREKHVSVQVWSDHGASATPDPLAQALTTHSGVVMYRPSTLEGRDLDRPVLLHELLHAYHDHVLGFDSPAIASFFKEATDKHLYPADLYLMTNEREFFAVTASVIIFGSDGPLGREQIKKAQPGYYGYIAWLFGIDPDHSKVSPVASAK